MDRETLIRPLLVMIVPFLATGLGFALPVAPDDPPQSDVPNILVIVADDLGVDQLHAYDDVNYYSYTYPYAYTPYIDDLADQGVRFTQARTAPRCSPSRAMLNSGRYPFENGCGTLVLGPNQAETVFTSSFRDFDPSLFGAADHTLADVVRERGTPPAHVYLSALIGKCHLGIDRDKEPFPENCGNNSISYPYTDYGYDYATDLLHYDEFQGVLRGLLPNPNPGSGGRTGVWDKCDRPVPPDLFKWFFWHTATIDDPPGSNPHNGSRSVMGDGGLATQNNNFYDEYYTHYEREAVADWMIDVPPGRPFLMVWAALEPHTPYSFPPTRPADPWSQRFGTRAPTGSGNNTCLRAKIEYLDSSIGYVLDRLETEAYNKYATLTVILVGDNGTNGPATQFLTGEVAYPGHVSSTGPDDETYHYATNGGPTQPTIFPYNPGRTKNTVYEGGVRVPLIVWGTSVDTPGRVSDQFVDMVDLYETIRELTYSDNDINDPYTPPTGFNSYSFAWVIRNESPPTNPDLVRGYSYGVTFSPNTLLVPPPSKWTNEQNRDFYHDYYIRYVPGTNPPSTEKWYKLIRKVTYGSSGPPSIQYEFYALDFSGNNPPEGYTLYIGTHPQFGGTKNALEALTGIQESDFQ